MKRSILVLSLLASSTFAMEEKHETPMIVKTIVGQTVALPVCTYDRCANVFYRVDKAPNESILKFVKDEETRNSESETCGRISIVAKHQAVSKGITAIRFGLYASHMCKSLGFVSYTVVVE